MAAPGAHNAAYIGPNSSTAIGPTSASPCGYPGCELIAIINQSNSAAQSNLIALYDGPSVAAVQAAVAANAGQTQYPLFQQVGLGIGQTLPFTFGGRGIRMSYGIVAIPAGAANSDGGWTIIYD